MRPEILSEGLGLAMAFGPDWLRPIQARLGASYPELGGSELDEYDRLCREAMEFGHLQVRVWWHRAGSEPEAFRLWSEEVRARFPWATDRNLKHLFGQGRYYAWQDGDL